MQFSLASEEETRFSRMDHVAVSVVTVRILDSESIAHFRPDRQLDHPAGRS